VTWWGHSSMLTWQLGVVSDGDVASEVAGIGDVAFGGKPTRKDRMRDQQVEQ